MGGMDGKKSWRKKRKNGREKNGLHVNVQQKEATFKGNLPCK